MPGGKVHGRGGKKEHAGLETLKKLRAAERAQLRVLRQKQRRQKKHEEKIIRVMKNTKMLAQLFDWARQEIRAVFSKIRKKRATSEDYFKLLAIDSLLAEKLPIGLPIFVGKETMQLREQEKHVLSQTKIRDILEILNQNCVYTTAQRREIIQNLKKQLGQRLPKIQA